MDLAKGVRQTAPGDVMRFWSAPAQLEPGILQSGVLNGSFQGSGPQLNISLEKRYADQTNFLQAIVRLEKQALSRLYATCQKFQRAQL